ncbi:MAG: HNH endonuclease [Oscillospiraceae bacterium]|nr:HNH endonuclease [Oscillospiraceae bacterium]
MKILNEVQIKLAEQLLLSVKNHEMNIEYNELASRINPPIHWRQVGKNIGEISILCHELGLPLLSAKVINKSTRSAGDGFYALYEMLGMPTNGKTEKELYHEEREAIRKCTEWYKLEDYLHLNVGMDRPKDTPKTLPQKPTAVEQASRPSEWIFPCNLSTYNVHQAYANLSRIDWKQSCNVSPGDTVYIYVASPEKKIAYKCIVIKTDKPVSTIDDSAYAVNPEHFANYGRYVELQFVYRFAEVDIKYETLRKHGLNSNLQGPIKLNGELSKFLQKSVDDDAFAIRMAGGLSDWPVPMNRPHRSKSTLNSNDPDLYEHSVDVLNYCFGPLFFGKLYDGFQRGAKEFSVDGTSYMVWFPKISIDGKPVSSSGWINTLSDDGYTIIEEASSDATDLGYDDNGDIRLVFAKRGNLPYMFIGVFTADSRVSTQRKHIFHKVANIADFAQNPPHIDYFRDDFAQDAVLVSEVNEESLDIAPASFAYGGAAKKKADPIVISGHRTFPRDRKTAVNALIHANYSCEYDPSHRTFLRRNSGKPYTEPHHLIPMAFSDDFAVSLDVEENIVSLCSNCHNQIHYGQGAEELLTKLYNVRKKLLKGVGIDISLEKLLKFYQGE